MTDPARILVITLSNIGDAIMTTPVMEFLHHEHPQARMDIVADPRSSRLFDACPYRGNVFHRHKRDGVRGLATLLRQLRRTRYELIVDLRTDGLTCLLHGRRKLTRRSARPLGPHAVERHMAVLAREWPAPAIPPTRVWLTEAQRGKARQSVAVLPGRRWLALGPGANWPPKIWPMEHYRNLLGIIRDQIDAVLLLGNDSDRHLCAALARQDGVPTLDLSGRTDLLESAAVLEQALAFIGNDSGLGHLAAAVDVPTLTLFGPGEPPRYHPWHPRARWLSSPTGQIHDLSVDRVATQLRQLIASGS